MSLSAASRVIRRAEGVASLTNFSFDSSKASDKVILDR
jgi:hypothetical protein